MKMVKKATGMLETVYVSDNIGKVTNKNVTIIKSPTSLQPLENNCTLISKFLLVLRLSIFSTFYISYPTTVHVQEDMISPAESHDKCNPAELNPDLQCSMIKRYLTCKPRQCGTGHRFRCDCSVYE